MTTIGTWRAELVAAAAALGLRVTDDPRAVNPPCVLVGVPATVALGANRCTVELTGSVYLVAPGPPAAGNVAYLVDNVLPLMWAVGGRTARATDLSVADGAPPYPTYEITVTATRPDERNPAP